MMRRNKDKYKPSVPEITKYDKDARIKWKYSCYCDSYAYGGTCFHSEIAARKKAFNEVYNPWEKKFIELTRVFLDAESEWDKIMAESDLMTHYEKEPLWEWYRL